jgi:prolyl oligopeptidase
MQVLTLHESVPGHHLQLSLAQEMENVPEFRKHSSYNAFAEGWALYCERLGAEMGFYKDPYSKFGQLTFEMWRACRLVIDTGIHSQGWSRQQAIDYLMTNAGKDEHDATVEIDRYIASPGQALAYKIGQLNLLALRDEATRELGDKFDLCNFHDALLANGSLPLPILDDQMKAWIATQKTTTPAP